MLKSDSDSESFPSPTCSMSTIRGWFSRKKHHLHAKMDRTPILESTGLARTKEIRLSLNFENNDGSTPQTKAIEHIRQAPFFKKSDEELITLFGTAFKDELEILTRAKPTAESSGKDTTGGYGKDNLTPSKMIFPNQKNHPEVNRTLVGALTLKWIVNFDYKSITSNQHDRVKLSEDSLREIQRQVLNDVQTPTELYALLVSMIINDLGKAPEEDPSKEVKPKEGKSESENLNIGQLQIKDDTSCNANHDVIIYQQAKKDKIALLMEFKGVEDNKLYDWLLLGLKIGATLNIPQFAQGENVPGSLSIAHEVDDKRAFDLKVLEVILDIAGAQGHVNCYGAVAMLEPTWQSFNITREILFNLIEHKEHYPVRKAYDDMLEKRAALLVQAKFRHLDVKNAEDRALLRLIAMGRASESKGTAEIIQEAFLSLENEVRAKLVDGLSVDGTEDGTAIIPYYAPACIANLFSAAKNLNHDENAKVSALAAFMRLLVRVFRGAKPDSKKGKGLVVECSMEFAKEFLSDEAFWKDPKTLDSVAVPEDKYNIGFKHWV